MSHRSRAILPLLFAWSLIGAPIIAAVAREQAEHPPSAQTDAQSASGSPGPVAQESHGPPPADAAALIEQVTALLRDRDGKAPDPTDVVGALNSITVQLYQDGQYAEAIEMAALAMEHAERVLGPEHPDTLNSVNNLAAMHQAQGRYAEAEPLYRSVLRASEHRLGAEHPDTLTRVNNLAALYLALGRYDDAEPLFRRVLDARERALGTEHSETLVSVNNLAAIFKSQGRYSEAEPLYRRALDACSRVLGVDHPQTLFSLDNLAGIFESQGRYGEAEPLYRRALSTRESVLGAEHPDTLNSINNLAALYHAQGRYLEAEPLLRRALDANKRVLGTEHPQTLASLHNLAALYQAQGRFSEADPLYERALDASERVLGPEHPQTLADVTGLAGLYKSQGRYGEAEPLYRRVLDASERVLGAEHPQTLISVNNLAGLYESQGRYGEAESLYRRVLDTSERVLGAEHPDTLNVQLNLAALWINQARLDSALRALRTLDGRVRRLVGQELASTEQEAVRLQRLAAEARLQNVVFTLALVHPDNADARRLAADVLLRWKRLAADEEAVIARLARTSRDPRVVKLAEHIRASRRGLSRLVHLPRAELTEAARAALNSVLAAERRRLGALEAKLARLSRSFRGQQAARGVEWEAVQAALPPGSALLELRAYRPVDFKTRDFGEPRWLAMLLPETPPAHWAGGGAAPALRLWDLGPVADSADGFARLRSKRDEAGDAPSGLYQTLFGAIDAELARYETLFLAPDGFLDQVAFARLRVPAAASATGASTEQVATTATRYWIERQALRTVRVGRDLLPTPASDAAAGMLVLGGIDYDHFPESAPPQRSGDTTAALSSADAAGPPPEQDPKPLLLAMNRRLRAARGGFGPLAHTDPEATEVGNYFWDYYNRKAEVLKATAAAEARLKALAHPPRLLHLATHGFFLPRQDGAEGAEADLGLDRALTLAGLALAGANLGLAGKTGPDGEDGILYALEAQDLNLEGTELVALSACDTGQGRVDVSEGVYGLVRAFQIAGARNVLMTQWALNDPAARAFMVAFYKRWLQPGAFDHPAKALRATQLEWLTSDDPVKSDPRFWAPYVLIERG